MPDYDDLAFKPAMTWDELCEWAKVEYKYAALFKNDSIDFLGISFNNKNQVCTGSSIIATKVSYERMKNIIDNLYGDN